MNFSNIIVLLSFAIISFGTQSTCESDSKSKGLYGVVERAIGKQLELINKLRKNYDSDWKDWFIVEPTELETTEADEAMSLMFSIGTNKLLDTKEKLEYFCKERENLLIEISAWVIRKYTFNLHIRVIMSLILSRMQKKNDLYCANQELRNHFVEFTKLLTDINPTLIKIRDQYIDTLVNIQNAFIGITKIDEICCGFWHYKSEIIKAIDIKHLELRLFVTDMIDSYFGGGLSYLCITYQENSYTCSSFAPDPPQTHKRESILMNMIDAAYKLSSPILS